MCLPELIVSKTSSLSNNKLSNNLLLKTFHEKIKESRRNEQEIVHDQ